MIAFQEFLAYKTRVPVRGAILVNHDLDSVVLVRGWKKGASWSFPRGKINKDEPDLDCAIREVYEETGYNVRDAGLVPKDEDVKYIEMTMRDQHVRLYVFRDVPMDTYFEPRTRKEISKIQWYKLSELPTQKRGKNNQQDVIAGDLANHANKFYMVAPFIHGLKKWITQQKKLSKHIEGPKQILSHEATTEPIAPVANQKPELPVGLTVDGSPHRYEVGQPAATLSRFEQNVKLPTPTLTALPLAQGSASGVEVSEASIREKKSQSLLALLQGKPISNATELPQTPAEQVVKEPQMPPSPKHHHVKPKQPLQLREIFPSLHATNQALQASQDPTDHILAARPKNRNEFIHDTLRKNHPTFIPETNQSYSQLPDQEPVRGSQNHRPVLPSYPSTKSAFASLEQSTGFASAIPAASKLPPPKLTAQSSKLLDLFKSNKPAQAALEAIPNQRATSGLGAELGHLKEPANIVEQVSLEVSEIEDHHIDKGGHSNRAPSDMSFEMPANVDDVNFLPDSTPPRVQTAVKQSPRDNLAAWQSFQSTDAVRQAKERQNFTEREAARVAEEVRTGVKSESVQPVFQETWKKVKISGDDAERVVVDVTKHNTDLSQGASQRAVDRVPVPKLSSHEQELNGATINGQATAASGRLHMAPSTVDSNQKTVLVVENLGTVEAVHCMFPDTDRANILHVQSSGKRRHLVHFTSNEETLAALGRQPPQFRTKQGKPSPGQPRKPRVYPISLTDRRPPDQHDHAGQRAQSGDSHSLALGKARQNQAAHGLFEAESKEPAVKTQTATIPAVVTPSPPTLQPRRSEHQDTLLNLFKAPAVPNSSSQVTKSALEAPTPSFELSAMPSPGHSRETSRLAGPLGVQPIGDLSHILPMSLPTVKRQKATLAPRKPPVSATVDGPLNVPQFDMLTQKHQPDREAAREIPKLGASRKSPITILARPSKSYKAIDAQIQAGPTTSQQDSIASSPSVAAPTALPPKQSSVPTQIEGQRHAAPPPYSAIPPSTVPPLTTTSKSTKPSMPTPQTIRRPLHIRPQAHDSILSPISPLPSPKHSLPFDRRVQQTKEQKKSLLSIFNNPNSPTPSPSTTGSPVAEKEVKRDMGTIVMGPPPLPPSRVDSTVSALVSPPAVQVDFGNLSRTGTGKSLETPSSGRQTPKETKSFLLGYLDSVAQSGR